MAKLELSIRYSGDSLNAGRIPINELAPSMLALANAFQEYQELIYPDQPTVSLDIKATEKGSFIVDLLLVNGSDLLSKAINLLTGNESDALQSLIAISSGMYASFSLIKQIGKRKIKKEREKKDGEVILTLDDNTSITTTEDVLKAYKDIGFRKTTKEFVKPLESKGIDTIEFSTEDTVSLSLTKHDADSFDVPDFKEQELESFKTETYLKIESVAFEKDSWKFDNGGSSFLAKIEDESFLKDVEENIIQFGSTDLLKVELETIQYVDKNGNLKSKYAIKKVLDHLKGSKQLELDL